MSTVERQVLPLLGWDGQALVQARAWSAVRMVVCTLDRDSHERRQAAHQFPVTDPFLLRCALSSDPGFRDAPPPVTITGVIAARRTWPGATANLGGFSGFGALVAVLPPEEARRPHVALSAAVEGYGVVTWDGEGEARLAHHPDVRPRTATRTWVHRLVEEIVYGALLADDEHAISVPGRPRRAGNPAAATLREHSAGARRSG